MSTSPSTIEDTGLEVLDLQALDTFAARAIRPYDAAAQMAALQGIAHAFVEAPDTVLQELVNAAVNLCGADSAGISIVKEDATDESYYHWVATAGQYSAFLDAVLPRYPSACGVTLQRGRPQLFRVNQKFFDIMGITAPLVTDGILLPWQVDETRGTIFVMAHGRTEAFDQNDQRMMQMLADFAAMAVRHRKQQQKLMEQAAATAAADMANKLAHRINNPLQSLTNILYLAAEGHHGKEAQELGQQASTDLAKLSTLVGKLLNLRL
jgi:transcriptional regulator with GAF, ATPase, and Fis domain